jgi:hypothetical protein
MRKMAGGRILGMFSEILIGYPPLPPGEGWGEGVNLDNGLITSPLSGLLPKREGILFFI